MTRLALAGALGSGVLVVVLSACGGGATPAPQGSAVAAAPSQAASSVVEPSVAPSLAPSEAPSAPEATPTEGEPSLVLPSEAKDLEAVLPDTMCGKKATKASMTGTSFMANADDQFKAALATLGKQPSDVAFAFAFTESGCGAGIFRIQGVDQGALKQAILAEEQKSGTTYTQGSVGGKSVYISTQSSSKQYVYFAGDAVLFAQAKDDATAAGILQQLPG